MTGFGASNRFGPCGWAFANPKSEICNPKLGNESRLRMGSKRKTSVRKKSQAVVEEMRPEYRFDYKKAKPNRFASQMGAGAVAVVLDPDVAAIFKSSESVNALLRSVISALPSDSKP